ncbi:hypothetical protein TNCV_51511 [Trichonephila clavipes]|nr:hypothetical protein TNCV_51511 [Trichonephila clavipes]
MKKTSSFQQHNEYTTWGLSVAPNVLTGPENRDADQRFLSGHVVFDQLTTCMEILVVGPRRTTASFLSQNKKRQIEGFQKGVNDEKLLGSACVSGDEMGVSQR